MAVHSHYISLKPYRVLFTDHNFKLLALKLWVMLCVHENRVTGHIAGQVTNNYNITGLYTLPAMCIAAF